MFDRHEIEAIAKGIASRLGIDSLAWKLGISRNGVEQLVELERLELLDHPFFLARYGIPQTTNASRDELLDLLDEAAVLETDDGLISLFTAVKVIGGRVKPWGAIFSMLISGSLLFRIKAGSQALVRRILVRKRDLSMIEGLKTAKIPVPKIAPSQLISKADASEILNIGPREVTDIFADVPTQKGQRAKSLPIQRVLELGRRHITSAELALLRNVSVHKAYEDALVSGVPYLGPAGFCRQAAVAKFLR